MERAQLLDGGQLPAPVRLKARPWALAPQPARRGRCGSGPAPNVVAAVGTTSARDAEQPGHRGGHGPGAAIARVAGQPARGPQRADDQPGQHQDDQPAAGPRLVGHDVRAATRWPPSPTQMIASGSAQFRQAPDGSRQRQQRAQALAREQRHAEARRAAPWAGRCTRSPSTGVLLGVGPGRVERQALGPLQPGDVVVDGQARARRARSGRRAGPRRRPARPPRSARPAPGSHRAGRRAASVRRPSARALGHPQQLHDGHGERGQPGRERPMNSMVCEMGVQERPARAGTRRPGRSRRRRRPRSRTRSRRAAGRHQQAGRAGSAGAGRSASPG